MSDAWECEGCGVVVTDLGGDEMLGWGTSEHGDWFCPECVADQLEGTSR